MSGLHHGFIWTWLTPCNTKVEYPLPPIWFHYATCIRCVTPAVNAFIHYYLSVLNNVVNAWNNEATLLAMMMPKSGMVHDVKFHCTYTMGRTIKQESRTVDIRFARNAMVFMYISTSWYCHPLSSYLLFILTREITSRMNYPFQFTLLQW